MFDSGSQPPVPAEAPPVGAVRGGRLRRTAPLLGLTARTAGEAVVLGLRNGATESDRTAFHARTAERYTELLGRSKGALMKAGQLLSLAALGPAFDGQIQATYRAALARLRDGAPPMAPELAREVLVRELGARASAAFAEFEWEPIAAASIGQVHRARLHDGRAVAVKIQYPGVAEAIRADLRNAELLVTFLGLLSALTGRKLSLDLRAGAQELRDRILEELDYRLEAANQREFGERYRDHPFIHVPAVVGELSGARVLTQELVQGKGWDEALLAEQPLRDSWGEVIYRFCFGSVQDFGMFNADPHPGNFLFHEDGSISFLDFGCVKRLRRDDARRIALVLRECVRGDVQGTWRRSVEGGFFEPTGSLTPEQVFYYWREPYAMCWGEQPFMVTPEHAARMIEVRFGPRGPAANALTHLTMPTPYTVMGRLETCVVALLGELHASGHWRDIVNEHLEGADPVTELGRAEFAWRRQREEAGVGA